MDGHSNLLDPTEGPPTASLRANVVAGTTVVLVASVVAVALRVLSRRINGSRLALDDYLMFLALFFSSALAAAMLAAAHFGLGAHVEVLPPQDVINVLKCIYASQILWSVAICMVKISLLVLYGKLFGVIKWFRILAYFLGTVTIAWAISSIFALAFICQPIEANVDPRVKGKCIDEDAFYMYSMVVNCFGDLVILIMPLPAVWKMKASVAQKLQLSAIFSIGTLSVAVSVARLVSLFHLKGMDLTYSAAIPAIWTVAEPCLAIVAACMATYRPLVSAYFGRMKSRKNTAAATAGTYTFDHTGPTAAQAKRTLDSEASVESTASVPWYHVKAPPGSVAVTQV